MMSASNALVKLNARRSDYDKRKENTRGESKVRQRWETGGYHRPGSLNRHR